MDRSGKSALLLLFCLFLTGCPFLLGAGVGVGTYHVIRGDLVRLYRADYGRAWEAALSTVEEMEMEVVKTSRGETEGKIEAKRFDGSPVKVVVKQKALDVTELRVRLGAVGDKAKAERFHERFRKNVFSQRST